MRWKKSDSLPHALRLWRRQGRQRFVTVAIVAPPEGETSDPILLVGLQRRLLLQLAVRAWSAAYPGVTGVAEIYECPLASAAVAGRAIPGRSTEVLASPQRLVRCRLQPVEVIPDEVPSGPSPLQRNIRLLHDFMEAGVPHARVVAKGRNQHTYRMQVFMNDLKRILDSLIRMLGLPVVVHRRGVRVYLSRTDFKKTEEGVNP